MKNDCRAPRITLVCAACCLALLLCVQNAVADIATPRLPPVITEADKELVQNRDVSVSVCHIEHNRRDVALSRPAVRVVAKLPGPGILTYEIRNAKNGKILFTVEHPLDDMEFTSVANCTKGGEGRKSTIAGILGKNAVFVGAYPAPLFYDANTCYYGTKKYDLRLFDKEIWFDSHLKNGKADLLFNIAISLHDYAWQGATPVLLSKNYRVEKYSYRVKFAKDSFSVAPWK